MDESPTVSGEIPSKSIFCYALVAMFGFCPLASGSKGNCIYFGTQTTRLLIDAGLSASATVQKLSEINVAIETIQAILITHEHIDHIRGVPQLASKFGIPIFANAETAKAIVEQTNCQARFKIFTTGEPFVFGDLEVLPFSIPHDTRDPVAFVIKACGLKIGFCTDLGYATSLVRKMLERSDYLYLEANHQVSMVHSSARPRVYKERVLSKQGHLSNEACAELLAVLQHEGLKHVHLAHLSSECNSEELVLKMIGQALKGTPLSIAYQDRISKPILFENL